MPFQPVKYVNEVNQELRKVTWPTRHQTWQMTLLVIGVSAAVGVYIGGLDFLFQQLMTLVIK